MGSAWRGGEEYAEWKKENMPEHIGSAIIIQSRRRYVDPRKSRIQQDRKQRSRLQNSSHESHEQNVSSSNSEPIGEKQTLDDVGTSP